MLVPDLPCPRGSSSSAHLQIIDQGSNFPSALVDTAATLGVVTHNCHPAHPCHFSDVPAPISTCTDSGLGAGLVGRPVRS